MNLILYRGDTIYNKRTQPGIYRGNGLTSKAFFGGSDPAYIQKIGLLDTIRIHINPVGIAHKHIYDTSAYLSFSENINRALYWASNKKADLLEEVKDDYTETRYIFTAIIPRLDLVPLSNAIYEYRFACNTNLKTSNAPDPGFITWSLRYNKCSICQGNEKNHSILLIDTVNFLETHRHLSTFDGAYGNAVEDSEWLLLSNDPLEKFQSARIQRANFWSVNHYRLKTEQPRNPNLFSELGQIV